MFKDTALTDLQREVAKLKDRIFHLEQELNQTKKVNKSLEVHNVTLQKELNGMFVESEIPQKEFYTFDGEKRIGLWLSNGQKVQIDITAKSLNELVNEVLQAKVNNVSFMNTYKISSQYLDDTPHVVIWSNDVVSIFVNNETKSGDS